MHLVGELDFGTVQRLGKQGGFLLRLHQTEFAKDSTSSATESSRSNLIAMQHTVNEMYGEGVARQVANLSMLIASHVHERSES